jgi:dTDP-4-dehydrorhamnose 3,5-epimerase
MQIKNTFIEGLKIIEPKIFTDSRGLFYEPYNKIKFDMYFGETNFLQDNESKSSRGVLRGLHFQKPPYDQAKLVRCVQGKVLDVAVDVRKGSTTFLKHVTVELSEVNKRQLFIPRGFAHGFVVLSELAVFAYKVDNIYAPKYDAGIKWNDKELNIDWEIDDSQVFVSEKDSNLPCLTDFKSPFN